MDSHLINLLIAVISYFVCVVLTLSRKKENVLWICLLIPIVLNLLFWGAQLLTVPVSYREGTDKAWMLIFGISGSMLGMGLSFVAWIIGRWFNSSTNKTITRILLIAVSLCVLGALVKDVLSIMVQKIEDKKYDQVRISPNVSVSPADRQIAFAHKNAIYVADMDGANVKQITYPKEEKHFSPQFSIDGKKILFWAEGIKDSRGRVMLADSDGSNLKQLRLPVTSEVNVVLGDDEKIYYIASVYDPGATHSGEDIFEANSEGDGQRLTHLNAFYINYLDFSSEGRWLSFLAHYMGMPDSFWKLPLDGKGKNELIFERMDEKEMHYRMSPDGKYVAFTKAVESEVDRNYRYELFLMDTVSKKTTQLTRLNQNIAFPRFYHHQDKIIFAQDINWLKGDPVYELWEIRLDGTGLKKIDLSFNQVNQES